MADPMFQIWPGHDHHCVDDQEAEDKATQALETQKQRYMAKFMAFIHESPPGLDFSEHKELHAAFVGPLSKVMPMPRSMRAFRASTLKFVATVLDAALCVNEEYNSEEKNLFAVRVAEELWTHPSYYDNIRPTHEDVRTLLSLFLDGRLAYINGRRNARDHPEYATEYRPAPIYTVDPSTLGHKAAASRKQVDFHLRRILGCLDVWLVDTEHFDALMDGDWDSRKYYYHNPDEVHPEHDHGAASQEVHGGVPENNNGKYPLTVTTTIVTSLTHDKGHLPPAGEVDHQHSAGDANIGGDYADDADLADCCDKCDAYYHDSDDDEEFVDVALDHQSGHESGSTDTV